MIIVLICQFKFVETDTKCLILDLVVRGLGLHCLIPLSTIFQLYRDRQFY
jgi:hypothetical protein